MAKPPKELIDAVLDSLKNKPEEWRANEFATRHVSGSVEVWTANSYYGVKIIVAEPKKVARVYGGVTVWSSFFGPIIPWRLRVYGAAVALRIADAVASPDRSISILRGEA